MRVVLRELLHNCEIVHPSRLTNISATGRELSLCVEGHPWWREKQEQHGEGKITLVFEGVADAHLCLGDLFSEWNSGADEFLEEFSVLPVSRPSWAGPNDYTIYANAPLPEPRTLHAILEDYLWMADATKSARDFLNMPDGLIASFIDISASDSYMVAQGPLAIREIVTDELKRQSVPHNVLQAAPRWTDRLIVHIGGSAFLCGAAYAEFN
jgi:hypothetical protein